MIYRNVTTAGVNRQEETLTTNGFSGKLLSTREAADFLGVTTRTLKRWQKTGNLVPAADVLRGNRRDNLYSLEQLSQFREMFHKTMTDYDTNPECHSADYDTNPECHSADYDTNPECHSADYDTNPECHSADYDTNPECHSADYDTNPECHSVDYDTNPAPAINTGSREENPVGKEANEEDGTCRYLNTQEAITMKKQTLTADRVAEAEKFFNLLFGGVVGKHYGYLWTKTPNETFPFDVSQAEERAAMARKAIDLNNGGRDVYFGVNVADEPPATSQRHTAAQISLQITTVTDIDVRSRAHKGDPNKFPPDIKTAKSFLPFRVSLVVDSGYGLHCYCLYSDPVAISDDNRDEAKARNQKFIAAVRSRADKFSGAVDGVGDLARVLRVPGTFNYKLGKTDPPLCHVVEATDARFTAEELDRQLSATTNQPARPASKPARHDNNSDFDSTGYDVFRAHEMLNLIPCAELPYDDWLAVGMALKTIGFDCAVWNQWSATDVERFKDGECDSKWQGFTKDSVTIATLHDLAKQYGYDEAATRREWFDLHPEQAQPPAQADDDAARTTQDQLPDCPIALRVPAGFSIDPRGIWCKLPAKKQGGEPILVKITNTPILPTKIFCTRDPGGYSYEIAIRRDGQWHYATFDGRTLQDPRRVIDLCNDGASILAPKLLAEFFADTIIDISLPKVRVFNQPGWQKDRTFVDPCGGIDSTGTAYICKRSGVDYDEMFSACGNAEQWKQKLRDVISTNQQRLIRVVIGATLAPPLLKILHVPNFWVHLQGTKNSAKTALLRFALSIFGDPAEGCLLRTFDSSPKNRVTMATALNDLPQGIDELETLSPKERAEIEKSAYDFVSGVDGQRNKKNGEVREAVRFRGVRLSTGESPLLSSNSKGGAFKRTIPIHINQPLFSNQEARDLHIFSLENHGHYRKQWIDYIITNADAIKADFVKVLDRIAEEGVFSEYTHVPAETVDETHIRSVATCVISFFHFHCCLGLSDRFDTVTATQDAQHVLGTLPTKAESDDLNRAIDALASWVAEHPKNFATYAPKTSTLETAFGYETSGIIFTDGQVAIYPNALRRICEDELHLPSFDKFISDCFDDDLIDASSRREKAKQMKICGRNKRFYLFKPGVLADDPTQDDATEPDYDDAYSYYDK